jgi:Fe-S cluster assembly protein SufD
VNSIVQRTPAELALGIDLPHRRMEEWKWTDIRRMTDKAYAPRAPQGLKADEVKAFAARSPFAKLKFKRLFVVNGIYEPSLSTKGVEVSVADFAAIENDEVAVIGKAIATRGIVLSLSGNVDTPIEIVHIITQGGQAAYAVQSKIDIAEGATATVIETFVGEGDYFLTSVTNISVGAGARLDRIKAGLDSTSATHLASCNVTLGKESKFNDFSLTATAKLTRQNGTCTFTGEHADAKISGAYMLASNQHADTRLVVDHQVPNCTSRELFKCVMDNHARGIFQGKVIVRKNAQRTDGKQQSHALLLSETAEFDAKPELEIYADDVACGHGATSGDLDHDHMFYLMSRGIPKGEAKAMLIAAFSAEAIETIESETIREALQEHLAKA